jgi:hypothetical protein
MLVARLTAKQSLWQVLKVGTVAFDPRPGWLLLAIPIGGKPIDMVWIHPDTTRIDWIRAFNFGEPT